MNKKKAVFVTVLMTVMVLVIVVGLFVVGATVAFGVVAGVFFGYGVGSAAVQTCRWMMEESDALDPVIVGEEVDA